MMQLSHAPQAADHSVSRILAEPHTLESLSASAIRQLLLKHGYEEYDLADLKAPEAIIPPHHILLVTADHTAVQLIIGDNNAYGMRTLLQNTQHPTQKEMRTLQTVLPALMTNQSIAKTSGFLEFAETIDILPAPQSAPVVETATQDWRVKLWNAVTGKRG